MFRVRSMAMVSLLGLGLTSGGAATIAAAGNFGAPRGNPAAAKLDEERHPEIRKALEHLHKAREALVNAAHDYQGHRKAALDATDAAIAECEACLKIDQ